MYIRYKKYKFKMVLNFMKNCWYLIAIAVVATSCSTPSKKETHRTVAKLPPYVVPPVPTADVPFETYTFQAEQGTKVAYKTGTQIEIPANALLDEKNKPVKGKVTLSYREFHDALDVLVSGIPMQYDSAGTKQSLQTAGMFDIRASQEGKNLRLAKGKEMHVRMASWQPDADYNFYSLDTIKRNWEYKTREKVEINQTKVAMKVVVEQMRSQLPATRFVLNIGNAFDISVDNDYDQMKKDALRQAFLDRFSGYNVRYTNEIYAYTPIQIMGQGEHPAHDLVWELVGSTQLPTFPTVKKEGDHGFFNAGVTPIGNGVYRLDIYNGWKPNKDGKILSTFIAKPIMRVASLLAYSPAKWKAEENMLMEKIRKEEEQIKQIADVFRSIAVSNFGIHNFDRYMKDDLEGKAVFVDAYFKVNGKPDLLSEKQLKKVFFINPVIRSSAEYYGGSWNLFGMVPGPSIRIFALLADNKLAIVTQEDYNKIDFQKLQPDAKRKDRATHTFTLQIQTDLVKTQEDLRKTLQMN